jgi:16S rRNA (guanine(966)-N(2))-methyltransferase RsmD
MRIISGKYKGRRLSPPATISARPTTDFAKEGLFNVLNNRIDFEAVSVLDLFAGTGGISFEFASRNCLAIVCVEKHKIQTAFIEKTKRELGLDSLTLLKMDVFSYLARNTAKFDLIFADPPYDLPDLQTLPDIIIQKEMLNEDGVFILEHPSKISFSQHPNFKEHRHYGNVNFSFFE